MTIRRLALTAVTVAALAALVAGLAPLGAAAAPFRIKVGDGGFVYDPKTAHVPKGKTVEWENVASVSHTVTFYKKPQGASIKSFTLSPGDSKRRTVRKAGRYKYRCVVTGHSSLSDGQCTGMCGVVRAHS